MRRMMTVPEVSIITRASMGKLRREVVASRLYEFAQVIGERCLISASVGPYLDPVILSLEQDPDYRTESPGWASFAKKRADRPNRFRIHHLSSGAWRTIDLPEIDENYHSVQPLGPEEWLLVRGRSDDDEDRNAHVYDASGRHLRSFPAGDGIQDVQTTPDGRIWVSYFDEGVFGGTKLGGMGLVCLDGRGHCSFRFTDILDDGLPGICDCYALNVVSDREVWLCYYTDFPLVKLLDNKVDGIWPRFPVGGSPGFAVDGELTLFAGGYSRKGNLYLVRPGERNATELTPVSEDGRQVGRFAASGRQNRLFLQTEEALLFVDVPTLETRIRDLD